MLLTFAGTKLGTVVLLVAGAVAAWAEDSYHESLLNANVSTLSILSADAAVFFVILAAWSLSSQKRRRRVVDDFAKFSSRHWLSFLAFGLAGLVAAYGADVALVEHGAHNMNLAAIVIGLGVASGIYMLKSERIVVVQSAPWLMGLVICAVGLAMSRQ